MLGRDIRSAILTLHNKGCGVRPIARALNVSREAVRRVLEQGTEEVVPLSRASLLTPELERVRELYVRCEGNISRVHEELNAAGIVVAYPTVTEFCRKHQIGTKPKVPAGRYSFEPGEEMQHDTSPHDPLIAGKRRRLHCASLALCYSHMLYAQGYPRWNRFWCKVFLTEACEYFEGAAERCMLDNSSIIIAHGTGKDAVPAPEMAALARQFGFEFVAHRLGDANRSTRVERPFDYIENNFYKGREFADVADLNRQLRNWCDRVNAKHKRSLRAAPRELFAAERPALRRLPLHVHTPTEVHHRTVDCMGYVTLYCNHYSVPASLLDHWLDVLATKDRVRIFDGHHLVCEHPRFEDSTHQRNTLPEHREERRALRAGSSKSRLTPQEKTLSTSGPALAELVRQLKRRHRGRAIRAIRRLHQMYLDYPTDALRDAVQRALDHGLYELDRIETIVLSQLTGSFFRESPLPSPSDSTPDTQDASTIAGHDLPVAPPACQLPGEQTKDEDDPEDPTGQ